MTEQVLERNMRAFNFRRASPSRAVVAVLGFICLTIASAIYMAQQPEPSFWPVVIAIAVWTILLMAFTSVKDQLTIEPEGLRSKRLGFVRWTDIAHCTIDDLRDPPGIILHLEKGQWSFGSHPMMDYQEQKDYEAFFKALRLKLAQQVVDQGIAEVASEREPQVSIPMKSMTDAAWLRWLVILLIPLLVMGLFFVPERVVVFLPVMLPVIAVVLLRGRSDDKT